MRDHCHYTGKYRGPPHQKCNLQYAIPHYIPIIFHNLTGYDSHLFIRELWKKFDSGSISVIAENKEKYISFDINVSVYKYGTPLGKKKQIMRQLQFIDSIRFMVSSLYLLSRNLVGVNEMVCERCESEAELRKVMRTMSLMEHVGSAEVQVIEIWRLTPSSIISELVIWMNSSDCFSEREFIPMNM